MIKHSFLLQFIAFILIMIVAAPSASSQTQLEKGWKAGVSSVNITPTQPMWMAGYANRDRPSEGIIMDLWAKALVLEDSRGKQAVIITADLVGIPRAFSNQVRDRLQLKFNFSRSQILINSSHTHTGPVLSDALVDIYPVDKKEQRIIEAYTNELGNKLEQLVAKAIQAMQPADVFASNGVTRFQVNRRTNNESTLLNQTELKGPNDYAVPIIKVTDKSGKILAVAFGYACHNTVLNGYKFSGDYAGFAQAELEKSYPGTTALFLQGCGANLNPMPRRTVALARQFGQELAAAVVRGLSEDMPSMNAELSTSYAEIPLPLNAPPSKKELSNLTDILPEAYQKRWAKRLLQKLQNGDTLIKSYPYPVEVWKIGDQPIIALGGEVVVEYSNAFKKLFGQNIFVFGYSNDVMAYIPDVEILREGGYEGASSQMVYGLPNTWNANIESLIINGVLRLAEQVGVKMPEAKVN